MVRSSHMKWLNYHHLYYFKVIANEGGIARASRLLRLGQPTLSSQLKQLEETLECELFERKNRTMALTDSGKVVLEYAKEIFRLGDEMLQTLEDRAHPSQKTHVQIGCLDSIPKHLAMTLVQGAYKLAPCMVTVLEGKGDELLRDLANHKIDIVLTNFPAPTGDRSKLFSRSIARMPIVVCGAPKFKHLAKNFPHSIQNSPFVMPTVHSKLRFDIEHYFELNGINIETVAETQDTSLQKMMAIKGIGLVALSRVAVEDLLENGMLVEIGPIENLQEELWLISAQRKIQNPVSTQLMKTFQFKV